MKSTAEQLYIVHRSFYPAGSHVGGWISNIYPNLSAAQQGARVYLNSATDGRALPCTFTDGSASYEITIHPLQLPEHLCSDHGNVGWVINMTSWPNQLGLLRCPVEWDMVSRFTYEEACEHAAFLAHRSCDLAACFECQLLVVHDQTDMPHWFGENEVETHFTVQVFKRILISDEMENLRADLVAIDLVE